MVVLLSVPANAGALRTVVDRGRTLRLLARVSVGSNALQAIHANNIVRDTVGRDDGNANNIHTKEKK
jgi:hypothetical protein